jgi:hypothetical protein
LPEVSHRQAHELVTSRFALHPLQQLARGCLQLGSRDGRPPRQLHPAGQLVARTLELLQVQQARSAANPMTTTVRTRVCRRGDVRKAVGDDLRQLALEPGDLRP